MTATTNPAQKAGAPKAAALAGVIFSLLMIATLVILRLAAAAHQTDPGLLLSDSGWRNLVRFALNLVPFAGIAFLWFLGVLRNRLGEREDRFFATVFLGSGLLFVASLFAAAAVLGSIIGAVMQGNVDMPDSEYLFGLRFGGALLNVFAIKMAGVFTFSTCSIALRTRIFPRWVAITGFSCGVVLLLVITNWPWIALLFPLWILLVSAQFLVAELFRQNKQISVRPAAS